MCSATNVARRPLARRPAWTPLQPLRGMASLLLWTAALAALAGSVSAMPMLTEGDSRGMAVPPSVLEWYLQQRGDLQLPQQVRDDREDELLQKEELAKFRQWLETQLARLPPIADMEEPNKAVVHQPPAKRGNMMALCHFKICNMGRKRSPRVQPQDLP